MKNSLILIAIFSATSTSACAADALTQAAYDMGHFCNRLYSARIISFHDEDKCEEVAANLKKAAEAYKADLDSIREDLKALKKDQ